MAATSDADDRAFFGHPKALAYLSFTEAWERFSFYGMQTLLVLYMTKQLLLSGHVENIAGFPAYLAMVRWLFHIDATPQAVASATYGLYGLLVYVTPLVGGILADTVLGKTRTIITGALLMASGHFLMAFDQSFLLALLCLIVGSGCFKGNLASQVGGLYKAGDLRRADAFQIYYLGINGGVLAAPLVCGTLGEKVAWHYGFGAAGVGMLISIAIYLFARRHLPPDPPPGRLAPAERPKMQSGDGKTAALLFLLLPVMTASVLCNQQIFNAYLVWADQSVNMQFFGQIVPTSWLISLDTITSVSFLVGMVVFWRVWKTRFKEPDEIGKMTIGAFISVTGVLALAAGSAVAAQTGGKVAIWWCVAFHLLNSAAFANMLPVSLALFSRAAPRAMASTIIGFYYLHLGAGNLIVGKVGALLEKMSATNFWLMHAAIAGASGLVFLVVGRFFSGLLIHENTTGRIAPTST
jgi:POT family proton-dependent oligopeptide transporter